LAAAPVPDVRAKALVWPGGKLQAPIGLLEPFVVVELVRLPPPQPGTSASPPRATACAQPAKSTLRVLNSLTGAVMIYTLCVLFMIVRWREMPVSAFGRRGALAGCFLTAARAHVFRPCDYRRRRFLVFLWSARSSPRCLS
jgi:hypothetical protein